MLVASGTLNAVSTVQVSAQTPGQVKEIYADFKTAVKRGQPLARLDPAPYELRVKQAQADLDAARSAGASVKKLEAQLAQAQADLERSVIRAPVDGIVVLRNVDAGQSIAEAPPQVLFAIAPDLREMQVEAQYLLLLITSTIRPTARSLSATIDAGVAWPGLAPKV